MTPATLHAAQVSDLDTLPLPTADQDNTLHMRLLRYAKKMRGRDENHAAELAFEAAMAVKKEETMAQDWVREAANGFADYVEALTQVALNSTARERLGDAIASMPEQRGEMTRATQAEATLREIEVWCENEKKASGDHPDAGHANAICNHVANLARGGEQK